MGSPSRVWTARVAQNRPLWLLDILRRGAGQVMLQNNPLTGLLFIAGIFWGSLAEGNAAVGAGAIVGLAVATGTAILLSAEEVSLDQGLFGFNGILVGAAIPTFLVMSPATWLLLIIGAAVSTVAMLAIGHVTAMWGVPPLTSPFVLVSIALLLAAYSFAHVPIRNLGPAALPAIPHVIDPELSVRFFLAAIANGIAQVFMIGNALTGWIFVVALLVNSRWAALLAVAGSGASAIVALIAGAAPADISAGLYGFSPVLTAIALGCIFFRPSWRVILFALLGTVFTVIAQGAVDALIAPFGVRAFTVAFVCVTWLFLLPKVDLQPHPHAPLKDRILTDR